MKRLSLTVLLLGAVFGVLPLAGAATTNIYVEDWGTGNPGVVYNDGGLSSIGWTPVAVSQTAGPYVGIYTATPQPSDAGTGEPLPANTAYFSVLLPNQTNPGLMYTTNGAGAGGGGNSSFITITSPNLKTNLTFSCEERNGGGTEGTNYFAVQVGGSWYVATSPQMPSSAGTTYPVFTNATLVYTNSANVWNSLTINANDVTIGSAASPNLSSPITGVGIVILPTSGQPNFNRFAVQVFAPNPPPPNPPTNSFAAAVQSVYEGGGVSLVTRFTGTAPLNYQWKTNALPLVEGGRYIGTTNNTVTITNVSLNDATANGVTYSVTATNAAGATNSPAGSLVLNVLSRPSDMLYSETLPYAGPSGNLPLTGVGWVTAFGGGGSGGIFNNIPGLGQGANFDYSGFTTTATNASYTTVTNDTGLSGLPFMPISIAAHPILTFQAQFRPGNANGGIPGAVTTYWAVRVDGTWYSSAQAIPIDLTANSYLTNQYAFKTAASNWNNLTISGNIVTLGGVAASPLSGNLDGAGLVFVHSVTNTSMNFENFLLSTNPVSILPPAIGVNGAPWNQTVPTGGGASFGVSATGTSPFTYGWTLNGVLLNNGGRVSGAHSPTVTIANLTPGDNGQIIAWVTNFVGVDDSLNSPNGGGGVDTELVVTNPPIGTIYVETFPFVGPLAGNNYPVSSAGWQEAVPGTPNALYQRIGSDGAAFAFLGSPATTAYYTSTTSDTNQAGLPFPNIKLASYPDLSISVDIAPQTNAANVTAYLAVQVNGANWYVSATALPVPTTDSPNNFSTYTTAFNPAAANWKNLTILGSGASIGSTAASNLSGVMTGVGLVFVTVGSGGTHNFDNILITGSGLGGINVGPVTGGSVNLSWVGNPAVNLQSSTNLSTTNWVDVPNTLGLYSLPVSVNVPQKFLRLVQHP
jgi:hypothetical protein